MPKKSCPPGVICIENVSFAFIAVSILIVLVIFFLSSNSGKMMFMQNHTNTTSHNNHNKYDDYSHSQVICINPQI